MSRTSWAEPPWCEQQNNLSVHFPRSHYICKEHDDAGEALNGCTPFHRSVSVVVLMFFSERNGSVGCSAGPSFGSLKYLFGGRIQCLFTTLQLVYKMLMLHQSTTVPNYSLTQLLTWLQILITNIFLSVVEPPATVFYSGFLSGLRHSGLNGDWRYLVRES